MNNLELQHFRVDRKNSTTWSIAHINTIVTESGWCPVLLPTTVLYLKVRTQEIWWKCQLLFLKSVSKLVLCIVLLTSGIRTTHRSTMIPDPFLLIFSKLVRKYAVCGGIPFHTIVNINPRSTAFVILISTAFWKGETVLHNLSRQRKAEGGRFSNYISAVVVVFSRK